MPPIRRQYTVSGRTRRTGRLPRRQTSYGQRFDGLSILNRMNLYAIWTSMVMLTMAQAAAVEAAVLASSHLNQLRLSNVDDEPAEDFEMLHVVQVGQRMLDDDEGDNNEDNDDDDIDEMFEMFLLILAMDVEDVSSPMQHEPLRVIEALNCFNVEFHGCLLQRLDLFQTHMTSRNLSETDVPPLRHRTIDSFRARQCTQLFQFEKAQLQLLFELLDIPDNVKALNYWFGGEELFLISLAYLSNARVTMNDLADNHFGGDYRTFTYAIRWFCKHCRDRFGFLLDENSVGLYSEDHFREWALAIRRKLAANGYEYPDDEFLAIIMLIDVTCFQSSTPLSGPLWSNILNSPRHPEHPITQQSFYSGWLHYHGLKTQTATAPCGLIVTRYGVRSVRNHDLRLLSDSDLQARMDALSVICGWSMPWSAYGDRGYVPRPRIKCAHKAPVGQQLAPALIDENRAWGKVRICVEWDYARLYHHFPRATSQGWTTTGQMRMRDRAPNCVLPANFDNVYWVGMFLLNCYTCVNGSQTSSYFGVTPPSLEEYFAMRIRQV